MKTKIISASINYRDGAKRRRMLFALCYLLFMPAAFASSPAPFSNYGQIQNVQNYSSSPFWNMNGTYDQRMPVPVYVNGPSLSSRDCQQIIGALVASFCSSRNNCANMTINDARPTLTVLLASIPEKNYVTACTGYLETEFNGYKAQNANAGKTGGKATMFPTATVANPYATEKTVTKPQTDREIREQELRDLQANNMNSRASLTGGDFPTTIADISFENRMLNEQQGFKALPEDSKTYHQIKLKAKEQKGKKNDNKPVTKIEDGKTLCDYMDQFESELDSVISTVTGTTAWSDDEAFILKFTYGNQSPQNIITTKSTHTQIRSTILSEHRNACSVISGSYTISIINADNDMALFKDTYEKQFGKSYDDAVKEEQ